MVARSANSNARTAQPAGRARVRPARIRVVFAALGDVRRALAGAGDVAAEVAFQNDVNALLAAVARLPPAETASVEAAVVEAEPDDVAEQPTPPPRRARAASARR